MINKLINTINPFIVMEILEKATEMEKNGIDIIHLEVGEPDFKLPYKLIETSDKAMRDGHTHYTHSLGDMKLRETIAQHYYHLYGVKVCPQNVVITSGSSAAILLSLSTIIEPGDEVIVSNPGYACYPNFIKYLHGKVVEVPVYANTGFQYSPEAIAKKITPRTKAIIINSPMNPTGNLLSPANMREITSLGPLVISDEIYHGLVYEGKPNTILEFNPNSIVISGFSKAYAMTGLRLGYCILPNELIRPIQKLQQNLFICASSVAQKCGIVALDQCSEDLSNMKATYNKRRIYMLDRLKKLGFDIPVTPTGAFYIFVNSSHLSSNSYKLAFDILDKSHVGVTPGVDFGTNGEGFLRFSYANSIENIDKAMNQLQRYIATLNQNR